MSQDLKPKENRYRELRDLALQTKPKDLGLSFQASKKTVFGIVMDWHVQNGTASVISFITGDASIYFSSGGGIIGGGTHDNVKVKAMEFVEKAQLLIAKTARSNLMPLPADNNVIFYMLTNKGIYSIQEDLENISNHSSIWVDLFLTGNEVITELRKVKGF
jgi:hypothetical protein